MGVIVPDTSVIIDGILSNKIEKNELKVSEIIIHEAVLAELEHQANLGKAVGYLGLEELKKLRELSKKNFGLRYAGNRPHASEIRKASLGEIDSIIRTLAWDEDATLVSADKVQSKVAEARGIKVFYIPKVYEIKKFGLEKFFDNETMSVHLKAGVIPFAKRGMPGRWKFVGLRKKVLDEDEIKDLSTEIIENAKLRKDSFLEIERAGSTIAQIGRYRIVITRPPFSDGWEITAVRPVKILKLEDYKLSDKLRDRIAGQAEGILIAGSPGQGKSTCAQALAEYFASMNKIVKTVEAPRDLVLSESITQYSMALGSSQEIHDILLLSRPDYTIFDEMRNTNDFNLFADLRLAGIGFLGVVHATNPIDAIQRFIGRVELGIIPHIIDTVIFIKSGRIEKVLSLNMTVKVPSGMTEEDLSRPIVEIKDFETGNLEYEIYSYGDSTVVVPVSSKKSKETPAKSLAGKHLEKEMMKYCDDCEVEVVSEHKAIVRVPKNQIAQLIGKQGKRINEIEKRLGIRLDIQEIGEKEGSKEEIKYSVKDRGQSLIFYVDSSYVGELADVYVGEEFVFSVTIGNKGEIKIHKKSSMGKKVINAFNLNKDVIVRV